MQLTQDNSWTDARLRPPHPARGVIARARLDGLLDLVRSRALTVVKAPPGYGKTTVAQSWAEALAGEGLRVAWLSIDASDDDFERFFSAVAAAVRRACAAAAAPAAGVPVCEVSVPLRHRLAWLVAELTADPGEFFLVLDDFHEITQGEIHQALSAQLRYLPPNLHLIVLSRCELPVDLAALRAHDAVLEIDAQMLRFDADETLQLLRRAHPGAADAHEAAQLSALTGGWVAALRAALLSARLQGGAPQAERRAPGTLRSVNALFAELLEQLPPELLDFMQRVSVAERLCAPLAMRLSGRADAQAVLEQLERQQLFITAQDEWQQWFAFHRLFRDCLLRSARQRDPALVPALHRQAAAWSAEQGLWSEAIGHALAAGDTAQGLAWIEAHAMNVVGAGDLLTLLAWERQLRVHLVESPLRLRLAFAWGLGLAMACDKALVLLDGVEAELARAPVGEQPALRCECAALRAVVVCTTGDYELAATLAAQCGLHAPHPPWVESALRIVATAACLHASRWAQLYACELVARDSVPQRAADLTAEAYGLSIRGLAELRQGHLDDAAEWLMRGLALGEGSAPLAALPAPTLALVRYLQGRTGEAAALNAAHLGVNKRVAPIEGLYAAYLVAARIARLDGQPVAARRLLDEGESIGAARGWRRVEVVLLLEKLRLCLLDGRAAEAGACAARIEALAAAAKARLEQVDFAAAASLGRAWCALAEGRFAAAVPALQALLDEARREQRVLDATVLLGSLALAHQAAGDAPAAHRALREGCALVRASGAVRALLDQPLSMAPLLHAAQRAAQRAAQQSAQQAGAEPGLPAWQQEVLAHAWRVLGYTAAQGEADEPARPAAATALGTLSPREHHILQMMAGGQSNKEIARGLGIAPETVKTHVSKIFTKLGAQNRAQAAAMVVNA